MRRCCFLHFQIVKISKIQFLTKVLFSYYCNTIKYTFDCKLHPSISYKLYETLATITAENKLLQ